MIIQSVLLLNNRYSTAGKNSNNNVEISEEFVKGSFKLQPFYDSSFNISLFIMEIYKAYHMKQTILNTYLIIILKKWEMDLDIFIFINLLNEFKGIYNLIIQTEEGLFLIRDRFGVRPFYHGWLDDNIVVCGSEHVHLMKVPKLKSQTRRSYIYW